MTAVRTLLAVVVAAALVGASLPVLDVDVDGRTEMLGHADRIDFSVRTVVLVAVPPGRTGVGDVDGQTEETSPGWEE